MNEEDYGIKEALPQLNEETVKKLAKRLKDEIQVDQCGLEAVEEEDLTKDGLLGTRPAKILLKYWKELEGSIKITVKKNTNKDRIQIGGSKIVYHGMVDHSQHTTTYGSGVQIGGFREVYFEPANISPQHVPSNPSPHTKDTDNSPEKKNTSGDTSQNNGSRVVYEPADFSLHTNTYKNIYHTPEEKNTHGNTKQTCGSRVVYCGSVNRSQHTTTFGDSSQAVS